MRNARQRACVFVLYVRFTYTDYWNNQLVCLAGTRVIQDVAGNVGIDPKPDEAMRLIIRTWTHKTVATLGDNEQMC